MRVTHCFGHLGRSFRSGRVSLTEFELLLPGTDVDNLCNSDYDDETVVDMCLGEEEAQQPCSREELIELVSRLQNPTPGTSEAESNLMLEKFIFNCKHPGSSDLIFYPQEHFGGRSEPTPEEIVDKALRGQ